MKNLAKKAATAIGIAALASNTAFSTPVEAGNLKTGSHTLNIDGDTSMMAQVNGNKASVYYKEECNKPLSKGDWKKAMWHLMEKEDFAKNEIKPIKKPGCGPVTGNGTTGTTGGACGGCNGGDGQSAGNGEGNRSSADEHIYDIPGKNVPVINMKSIKLPTRTI